MRENGRGVAPGEELLAWRAAYRDFPAVLDDRFDSLHRDTTKPPDENIAEAEALGTHRRTIGEREDVMRRNVEQFGIREMQSYERIRVAHFVANDPRPRFAGAGAARTPQVLAEFAGFDFNRAALFGQNHRSGAQATSTSSARSAADTG